MKIYLASRYSRREELLEYKQRLEALGHTITSRWLDGSHQVHGEEKARIVEKEPLDQHVEAGAVFALDDVEDIEAANAIICFTEHPGSPHSRGGRHTEFGYALCKFRRVGSPLIFIVGPRENVFYCLPPVRQHNTFEELLKLPLIQGLSHTIHNTEA